LNSPSSFRAQKSKRELEIGGDEIAIGDAKNLVAATNAETLKTIFAGMDR